MLRTIKQNLKESFQKLTTEVHPSPVFVLGNQKSGTTAIAALLSKSTDNPATLDFFYRRQPSEVREYAMGRIDLPTVIKNNHVEFSRPIIKEPDLTFFAEDLLERFPGSPIVFVVRNPVSNIRSILSRLKIHGSKTSLTFDEFQALPVGWRILISEESIPGRYRVPEMETSNTDESRHLSALIHRWCACAHLILNLKDNERVRIARYEDFAVDKMQFINTMAEDLNLPIKCDIRDSLDVQYQPKSEPSVSDQEYLGSQNYEHIWMKCDELAKHFGY